MDMKVLTNIYVCQRTKIILERKKILKIYWKLISLEEINEKIIINGKENMNQLVDIKYD